MLRNLARVVVVALVMWACTSAEASEVRDVVLMVRMPVQDADSVGFVLGWRVVVTTDPRRDTVVGYEARLRDVEQDVVLDADSVGGPPATLWAPLSLVLGDTLVAEGCVRSVGSRGFRSGYACDTLAVTLPVLPPLPPDSVGVDTIPWPQLTSADLKPDDLTVAVGFGVLTFQFTAFDPQGEPRVCAQALFQELGDGTIELVPDGVCTDRVLVPADSVQSGGRVLSALEWVDGVVWTHEQTDTVAFVDPLGRRGWFTSAFRMPRQAIQALVGED